MSMLVFAHRGASGSAPDNTLASFELAIAAGTNAIESDVRATIDGSLVFFHDAMVKLGNIPFPASLLPLSWFQAFDAGYENHVPIVSDVFEHFHRSKKLSRITWSLDVPSNVEYNRLVKIARRFGNEANILACATSCEVLPRWKQASPAITMVWSVRPKQLERLGTSGVIAACKRFKVDVLNIKLAETTPGLVESARAAGLRVFIWDVHDEPRYRQAVALEPDAIYTNHPSQALDGTWKP
jgi:glycerophosphoryl diester phosphodiesterase